MSLPHRPNAVVTGAGSGLGRALCLALARTGAHIVAADVDPKGVLETSAMIEAAGGRAHVVACDVARAEDVASLVEISCRVLGTVDLVVHNAGVFVGGSVDDVPAQDWEWIMGVNLWGVIHGCRLFAPVLRRQGRGHILNIASVSGLVASREAAPYAVTKAGVIALSEALHAELRDHGVGVTVVCPSFFRTSLLDGAHVTGSRATTGMELAARLSRQASVQAEDVAAAAIAAVRADRLYALPDTSTAWIWRLKRLHPERFYQSLLPWALRLTERYAAIARR